MCRTDEEQYHHSLSVLLERYRQGFISFYELDECLHWLLDDLIDSV